MAYYVQSVAFPELTVTPVLVKDYTFNRRVRNIIHESIDPEAGIPDVTFRVAGSRTGSFTYVCASREDAQLLEKMHAANGLLGLMSDEVPFQVVTYVVSGDVVVDEDLNANAWVVTVPYRDVTDPAMYAETGLDYLP